MKLSLAVLATAFLSFSATASSYQNWMGSAVRVACVSSPERAEKVIVSTNKVTMQFEGTDNESVKNVEIYSQVQLGSSEVRRRYIINSVLVDQLGDDEEYEGHVFKPMIVSGKHPVTGEKIRIEIEVNNDSNDATEMQAAKLIIGGKVQKHKKLQCNVMFAG